MLGNASGSSTRGHARTGHNLIRTAGRLSHVSISASDNGLAYRGDSPRNTAFGGTRGP